MRSSRTRLRRTVRRSEGFPERKPAESEAEAPFAARRDRSMRSRSTQPRVVSWTTRKAPQVRRPRPATRMIRNLIGCLIRGAYPIIQLEDKLFIAILWIMRLEDLGLIGNCQFSALVDRGGSVVWSCLPRFDSEPVFSSLLDAESGGRSRWRPKAAKQERRVTSRTPTCSRRGSRRRRIVPRA